MLFKFADIYFKNQYDRREFILVLFPQLRFILFFVAVYFSVLIRVCQEVFLA